MRQNEIQIGGTYRMRIGDRLALVTVTGRSIGRGRARFTCLTHDTRREVKATAARLRPLPGTAVAALSAANADYVRRIVDGIHVAESFGHVARVVRRKIGRSIIFRSIPRALRRGLLHAAAERHAAGRRLYRAAMGHDPLPSERMVADAVGMAVGIGACPR
jgi:hypothetical protein